MTHLLPGGGVPRVHGARSPIPPRFPLFAIPRSVHHLAAVAEGAYPPRRPPNVCPCYWLVASGTPLGWRGGCLAAALVRGAVRYYCLGGCSALFLCARRSRPVQGGWGRCQVMCPLPFPLPAPRYPRCVSRAVPSGCPLSSLAATPFHAVCAFRGLGPVAFLDFFACPLCVRAPAPPWVGVARAPRAVSVLGAGRAVPRGPCPSPCPASVPCPVWLACRGGGPFPFRLCLAWGCVPPFGRARASGAFQRRGGGEGGVVCVPSSPEVRPGGPEGRGVALPRSVPMPSLGRQQSGCHWRRSCQGGRDPHTAPVRVRVLPPGVVRVAPLCAGAGSLACRGPRRSRRGGAWGRMAYGLSSVPPPGAAALSEGGGTSPLPWGGWRGGAPVARLRHPAGRRGGVGGEGRGRRAVVPHLPPPGGWAVAPGRDPPSLLAHPPQVYLFGRGRLAALGAGGSGR